MKNEFSIHFDDKDINDELISNQYIATGITNIQSLCEKSNSSKSKKNKTRAARECPKEEFEVIDYSKKRGNPKSSKNSNEDLKEDADNRIKVVSVFDSKIFSKGHQTISNDYL